MPLPKVVATGVCIAVLGTQLLVSSPVSPNLHGWYWPFLAYPMYAESHARSDSLIVAELRAARCGSEAVDQVISARDLGAPRAQLHNLLLSVARAPESETGQRAAARVSRAVEAQYPGQFCAASAWMRIVFVADTSTYRVHAPMQGVAVWSLARAERK
ncbi:MAG: hypothetical protein H0X34_14765 [Chthoniobacterales bacterium]|nr:hypothetical protein [Gemmatimonadaceae bacterium]MBA3833124.1 hypothetical protein [Chthoniobacterales bacterium]